MVAYSQLVSLTAKYGVSTDGSQRAGRLAPTENDLKDYIDAVVVELGPDPSDTYPSVTARLAAMSASTPGMRLSVRAATVLAATYNIATSFANGQVVDGVTLATGNSIALISMTDKTLNGVYTVQATGAPVRRADFASGADFPGAMIAVREGTVNKGRIYFCTNTSTPTPGSTDITWAAYAIRPVEITVGPAGSGSFDWVCDGVADEFEINLALFFVSTSPIPRCRIQLAAGSYNISSAIALSVPNSGHGVELSGAGREVTRLTRTTDTVAVDMSGAGTGSRSGPMRLADMKFISAVSPYANPCVKAYYAQDIRIERVDFSTMQSMAILGLELQDSTVTGCRFVTVGSAGLGLRSFAAGGGGSTGSGGRPAVLLIGDTAITGAGHTTLPCSNVTFADSVFFGCVDGSVLAHGNAADENYTGQAAIEHHGISVRNTRFDCASGASGWAPQVYVYRARNVALDCRVTSGSAFTGGTPQALIDVDTVTALTVSRYYFQQTTANLTRCALRVANVTGMELGTIWVDTTSTPQQGAIEFSGSANTLVRRGHVIRIAGTCAPYAGTPATEYATSGQATIPAGQTTVTFSHRLPRQPVDGEVVVSATSKPSASDPGHIWISAYAATTVTVSCSGAVTGSALTLAWRAAVADNG